MKRRAFKLVVFLLLGAIVNVAVAWAISFPMMQYDGAQGCTRLDFLGHADPVYTVIQTSGIRIEISQQFKDWPGLLLPSATTPLTPDWFEYRPGLCTPWLGKRIDTKVVRRFVEGAAGWPLLSVKYWLADCGNWAAPDIVASYGAIAVPYDNGTFKLERVLPYDPLWPGFAINTIFYAAVLWMMFAMPGVVRRRRRIKRGLCPACAYPVGTSPVCTECGAAV